MRRLGLLVVFSLLSAVAAAACDAVSPPVRDLTLPRFYADAAGTKVDPAADAAHKRAVEPLTVFLRHVVQNADKAMSRETDKGRREAAACALQWLATWAKAGAWLGTMATRQAEYQRKWDLAGVSLAYLKVKPFAAPDQRTAIEPWLIAWADTTRAFFDDPGRARNNHWYWLGLAQAGVGLATGSARHWESARNIAADAARDIGDDGFLVKELERGTRALHYHVFAVVPLVMMAELAAVRGEDWYGISSSALHRLVQRTHAGVKDPVLFEQRTNQPQEQPVNTQSGWLPLYAMRFPDRLVGPHPVVASAHRWLGGNAQSSVKAAAALHPK